MLLSGADTQAQEEIVSAVKHPLSKRRSSACCGIFSRPRWFTSQILILISCLYTSSLGSYPFIECGSSNVSAVLRAAFNICMFLLITVNWFLLLAVKNPVLMFTCLSALLCYIVFEVRTYLCISSIITSLTHL